MTQVAKQDATRPNSGDGGTTSRSLPRPAERPPNAPRGPLPLPRGLRRAFDAAADCIFIVNSEQRIVYWNRAGERLLNRSAAETVGGRCHQLVAGRTASGPWCRPDCPVWRSVLTGRTVRDFDLLTLSPDRQPVWVSVAILVLRQDREYLTVHVLHDISARKRLERLVTHLLDAFERYGVVPARPAAGEGVVPSATGLIPPGGNRSALTRREVEVLQLLAHGLSTRVIANRLHISPHTVRNHVRHALHKANLHNRTEAVSFAIRNGLF